MNCHEAEPLLFAERDGALDETRRASLAAHLEQCPACRAMQAELAQSAAAWRAADAAVATPAIEPQWHAIRRRIRQDAPESAAPRALRPWWLSLGMATALVALAAIFGPRWFRTDVHDPVAQTAGYVSYVVVHNATDSTMVYEDQQSGWLVVWVGDTSETSGS